MWIILSFISKFSPQRRVCVTKNIFGWSIRRALLPWYFTQDDMLNKNKKKTEENNNTHLQGLNNELASVRQDSPPVVHGLNHILFRQLSGFKYTMVCFHINFSLYSRSVNVLEIEARGLIKQQAPLCGISWVLEQAAAGCFAVVI